MPMSVESREVQGRCSALSRACARSGSAASIACALDRSPASIAAKKSVWRFTALN